MGIRRFLRAVVFAALIALVAGIGTAAAAKKTPPGSPPGNNGRIKVDDDSTADPNNEPHIDGCRLWLEFFGFDTEEKVKVTFVTQPPTGSGDHLLTWEGTVSDDPEAGDQDEDNVIGFNLSEALQPFEPHDQQGYHIKVSWDSVNAPGGEKHKVFWLQCNPVQSGTFRVQKLVSPSNAGAGPFTVYVNCNHTPADTVLYLSPGQPQDVSVPMGTTCDVTEDPASSQGATVSFVEENSNDDVNDGEAQVTGDEPVLVTVVNTYAEGSTSEQPGTTQEEQPSPNQEQPSRTEQGTTQEEQGSTQGSTTPSGTTPSGSTQEATVEGVTTQVAGETLTAPAAADTLPRTGTGSTRPLAALGSWALALGFAGLIMGRRRR